MTEPRPIQHLREIAAAYPGLWDQAAAFRRQRKQLGDWPEYCYLPMAGSFAIVSGGGQIERGRAIDVGRVAALVAWRATKGIYRFDSELLDRLLETPVTGHVPDDLLERLPEWCVYVELPTPRTILGVQSHGFYAHLEWDANDHRRELRLLLDTDAGLQPVPIHLTGGNLAEGIERMLVEASKHGHVSEEALLGAPVPAARELAPLVSVLLYLCSEEPDIESAGGDSRKPENPQPTKTRRGVKEFAAPGVSAWNVGWRIGAILRRVSGRERAGGDGEHVGPRPHVRAAHWHTYLVGAGRQRRILKWLSPILVGASSEELPATIRRVE